MSFGNNGYGPQFSNTAQSQQPAVAKPSLSKLIQGGGAKSYFNVNSPVGDSVSGVITDTDVFQQKDMQTGQPAFSKKGNPKWVMKITIQTDLHTDTDDDGRRDIYIKMWGDQLDALRECCQQAHVEEPSVGDRFTAIFTGLGTPFSPGMSAPKLFKYELQHVTAAAGIINSQAAQTATPVQQSEPVGQAMPQVDASTVIGLRNIGKTDQEIATLLGVPVQAVMQIPIASGSDEPEF